MRRDEIPLLTPMQRDDFRRWLRRPRVEGGKANDAPVHLMDATGHEIARITAGHLRAMMVLFPREGPRVPPTWDPFP